MHGCFDSDYHFKEFRLRYLLSSIPFWFALPLVAAEPGLDPEIEIATVRKILSEVNPIEHTKGQLRLGYIQVDKKDGLPDNSAFAVGGHLHVDSKRWHGWMAGIEGYAVINPGINSDDPQKLNPDFFDADGESFFTLSQAFVDGEWNRLEVKLGRQMLDTPHADADDSRMMPNYFQAATATYTGFEEVTLFAGWVDRMAGWENGVDAKRFVPVEKALGADAHTAGLFILSVVSDRIEETTLQAWYYGIPDIANVLYLEAGREFSGRRFVTTVGLQFDAAEESGKALLGDVQSRTAGVSLRVDDERSGLKLLAAFNRSFARTGAFTSLGGGPFFTSMDMLGIDGIDRKARAWMVGVGYDYERIGLSNLHAGIAWGGFRSDDRLWDAKELDISAAYNFSDRITGQAVYADVTGDLPDGESRTLRLFVNFNFAS